MPLSFYKTINSVRMIVACLSFCYVRSSHLMISPSPPHLIFISVGFAALVAYAPVRAASIAPVPTPATERIATTQVRVVPDRADWNYQLGETAKFRVEV